jgi:hypothetical protein
MIWVGTENAGLLRYTRERHFDYCIAQEESERIQYDYKIFNLFQDKEQNIWVGTIRDQYFNPYRQQFKSIRHEENNDLSIPKSEIISFIQTASGDMYIAPGVEASVYDSNFNFKKNILFGSVEGKEPTMIFDESGVLRKLMIKRSGLVASMAGLLFIILKPAPHKYHILPNWILPPSVVWKKMPMEISGSGYIMET